MGSKDGDLLIRKLRLQQLAEWAAEVDYCEKEWKRLNNVARDMIIFTMPTLYPVCGVAELNTNVRN